MVWSVFSGEVVDEVSLKAEKRSIGETDDIRNKSLQILTNKLLKEEKLKSRLDHEFLLRFLRVAKFDAGKAYERICKYYSVRRKYSCIFDEFYPSAAKSCLEARHFIASPRRAEDNSVVVFLKRGRYDTTKMVYEEMLLLDCLILDYLVQNPVTQVCGATVVLDMEGYGFNHMIQDTPKRVRMAIDTFQHTFPLRFKFIHVVNPPQVFSVLYNICSPFLTKKIRKRLQLHCNGDNWESLHAVLPPEILPEEYGGKIPDSDVIDLTQEVIKKENYFKEQLQYGYIK